MAFKGSDNKMVRSGNYLGNIGRTKKVNPIDFRSTFSAGYLFPIYAREIYPSMNVKINCGELVRSITPLGPTMDNSFLDIFFFAVPNRLLWDHWEEFIAGYNKEAWAQDVEYTTPQIIFKASKGKKLGTGTEADPYVTGPIHETNDYLHSFLDYLPNACDVVALTQMEYVDYDATDATVTLRQNNLNDLCSISALYPRAYIKIWNDWFRDENLQDEYELYTGDNDEYADEFAFNLLDPTALPKAAKLHDRITSALPAPVKGPDVLIPMNDLPVGIVPNVSGTLTGVGYVGVANGEQVVEGEFKSTSVVSGGGINLDGSKVYASNVSNTIRMLRLATQTELLLARDARGGTRYVESILSHFKVHNGDARMQRAEYLGSRSIPLNVQQVTNTAQAGDNALGNVGGQSVTKDYSFYFSKGFSEYCILLGVAVVRTNISRSSGIHKQYQRKGRFDYIWSEFKHVGDVPLYTREVFIGEDLLGTPDRVFGYTPYGSELRTGMSFNNGLFRNKASGSLSYLTYQEDYDDPLLQENLPILSADFIKQPTTVVSHTLIDQNGPQFYALFHMDEELVIPLDPTSDPGLMDHF